MQAAIPQVRNAPIAALHEDHPVMGLAGDRGTAFSRARLGHELRQMSLYLETPM